jgi:hypothetical protein
MISPLPASDDPTYEEDNILEVLNQGNAPLSSPPFRDFHKNIDSAAVRSRLFLMVQSPFQLYAYWDLAAHHLKKFLKRFPREDRLLFQVVIRCRSEVQSSSTCYDVGATTHWWFKVSPNHSYQVDLCLYSSEYGIIPFLGSNTVKTPAISLAPIVSAIGTNPAPLPLLEKLIQLSGVAFDPTSPQTEAVAQAASLPETYEQTVSARQPNHPAPVSQPENVMVEIARWDVDESAPKPVLGRAPSSDGFLQSEIIM